MGFSLRVFIFRFSRRKSSVYSTKLLSVRLNKMKQEIILVIISFITGSYMLRFEFKNGSS